MISNRDAPAGEGKLELKLEEKEHALVVRGDRFAKALGGVFADLRQVKRRRADGTPVE